MMGWRGTQVVEDEQRVHVVLVEEAENYAVLLPLVIRHEQPLLRGAPRDVGLIGAPFRGRADVPYCERVYLDYAQCLGDAWRQAFVEQQWQHPENGSRTGRGVRQLRSAASRRSNAMAASVFAWSIPSRAAARSAPATAAISATAAVGTYPGMEPAGNALHAPTLFRYEIANALTWLVVGGQLDEPTAASAWTEALNVPVELHELKDGDAVIALARTLKRRSAYDAAYIALAQQLGTEVWTFDGRLAPKCGADRPARQAD